MSERFGIRDQRAFNLKKRETVQKRSKGRNEDAAAAQRKASLVGKLRRTYIWDKAPTLSDQRS